MHMHAHHGHAHWVAGPSQQMDRAMGVGVVLNVVFVVVELVFGFAADSLALI